MTIYNIIVKDLKQYQKSRDTMKKTIPYIIFKLTLLRHYLKMLNESNYYKS